MTPSRSDRASRPYAERQARQYARREARWRAVGDAAEDGGAYDLADVANRRADLDAARSRVYAGIASARAVLGPGALLPPDDPALLARYAATNALTDAERVLPLSDAEAALRLPAPTSRQ